MQTAIINKDYKIVIILVFKHRYLIISNSVKKNIYKIKEMFIM